MGMLVLKLRELLYLYPITCNGLLLICRTVGCLITKGMIPEVDERSGNAKQPDRGGQENRDQPAPGAAVNQLCAPYGVLKNLSIGSSSLTESDFWVAGKKNQITHMSSL